MTPDQQGGTPRFRVIDALDAPHFGQILRLRLQSGATPLLKAMKGGRFTARSPEGAEVTVRVMGFSTINGKPNQGRFARTGRVDVVATLEDESRKVATRWTLTGPS